MRHFTKILMIAAILKLFGCNGQDKKSDNKMSTQEQLDRSMEDFLNRPIYKTLTKEIIDKTKDEELEQLIFDNISTNLEEYNQNGNQPDKQLTKGQVSIYSTWMVETEVNNGGFNQFYFNTSGEFGDWAEEGFETVGAVKFAALMRQANGIYKEIKDDLEKINDGTVERFSESYKDNPLNEIDDRFYELYKHEPLKDLKVKYIRKNVGEFITP